EPVGINEAHDLHHSVSGPHRFEELAVDQRDGLPIFDARQQYARAGHVAEARAQLFERRLHNLETAPRLRRRVADGYRLAVRPNGRSAGDGDDAARPHAARDAYARLVWRAG